MRVHSKIFLVLAAAVAATIGCSGDEPPVGSLTVEPQRMLLGFPAFQSVDLTWRPSGPLGEVGGELKVMVHLLNGSGDLVRTFDHPFPDEWRAGSEVAYPLQVHQSLLGPALQPGDYSLTIGLYDLDRRRWPLEVVGGEDLGRREYRVASVEVPAEWAEVPSFDFGDGWGSVEGGADLQILGRRRMNRAAVLALTDLSVPGIARLSLRIPEVRPGVQSLLLDEGENEPIVTVKGSCGDIGACCSGFGEHRLELPIATFDEGGITPRCDLEFSTNFTIVDEASGTRSSVVLDGLSWSTDSG